MAALSGPYLYDARGSKTENFQIVNALRIYRGAFVGLFTADAAAANRGRIRPWATGVDHLVPAGLAYFGDANSKLGDTAASPIVEAEIDVEPAVVQRVPVAGASTVQDTGRLVYVSTDNVGADLTITAPAAGDPAVGIILHFRTATSFDVRLFGLADQLAVAAGATIEHVTLGTIAADQLANGNVYSTILGYRARVLTTSTSCWVAPAGSGGTAALNVSIDGVAVTGGVATIATGNALGSRQAGTAVTGADVIEPGSTVRIVCAGLSAFTEGRYNYHITVLRLPGA